MTDKKRSFGRHSGAALRALLVLMAAATVLLPGRVMAQAAGTGQSITYGAWQLICQPTGCAIAHRTVRTVIIFGYNVSDGKLVMQVRLPTDAPVGRPVAIRMDKTGTLLQMRVGDCEKTYCVASAAPDKMEQVTALFLKEPGGTLGYQLAQDLELEVFSLNGFGRALEELRKHPSAKPAAK